MQLQKKWILVILVLVLLAIYQFLFPLPPQTNLIRYFALAGFFLLCLSLMIGPSVVCFGAKCAPFVKHRRRVGVLAFIFVAIHFLLVFVYSYGLSLAPVFMTANIFIASIALIILLLLAVTSFNAIMQAMGFSKWKLLQRFVYVAFILSFIHFYLDSNGLFVAMSGGKVFLNLAEAAMIGLGVVTIILQVWGFIKKSSTLSQAPSVTSQAVPAEQSKNTSPVEK